MFTLLEKVLETISKLEQNINNQNTIDETYVQIKNLFNNEIEQLPLKSSNNAKQNKNFKKGQGFWNEELGLLWSDCCDKERAYLNFKCKNNDDKAVMGRLREVFKQAQKLFDEKYCYYKRKFNASKITDLKNAGS